MLHVKSVCTPCCMVLRRVARILKELFSEYQSKNSSKDFFPGSSLEVILMFASSILSKDWLCSRLFQKSYTLGRNVFYLKETFK